MVKNIIIVCGATATGKTKLAINLAKKYKTLGDEYLIVNCDSKQVYIETPILSASPTLEEKKQAKNAMFNYISIFDSFSLGKYLADIENIIKKEKNLIIVGGTFLYLSALLNGVSAIPEVGEAIRLQVQKIYEDMGNEQFREMVKEVDIEIGNKFLDKQRLCRAYEVYLATNKPLSFWQKQNNPPLIDLKNTQLIMLNHERDSLITNIKSRIQYMLDNNVENEVKNIINSNFFNEYILKKIIGLLEIKLLIENKINKENAIEKITTLTIQYAKRQKTWLKNKINPMQKKMKKFIEIDFNETIDVNKLF
jgi:tRNA dimethylallyltransferase